MAYTLTNMQTFTATLKHKHKLTHTQLDTRVDICKYRFLFSSDEPQTICKESNELISPMQVNSQCAGIVGKAST